MIRDSSTFSPHGHSRQRNPTLLQGVTLNPGAMVAAHTTSQANPQIEGEHIFPSTSIIINQRWFKHVSYLNLLKYLFTSFYYLKWIDKGLWKTWAFSSCFYWRRILESRNGWSHSFRLLLAQHEGQRPCVLVRNWCTNLMVRSAIPHDPGDLRKNGWGHEDKHA